MCTVYVLAGDYREHGEDGLFAFSTSHSAGVLSSPVQHYRKSYFPFELSGYFMGKTCTVGSNLCGVDTCSVLL